MIDGIVRPLLGTIALYVDLARDHARAAAATAAAALRDAGYAIALTPEQDVVLGLASQGSRIEEALLLVTIGGDGTLLRATQLAAPHGIPLFGINTGRLGFLTEMDGDAPDLASLPSLIARGFSIDERLAIEAEVHGKRYVALNEIVVRRQGTARMTPFGLIIDGKAAAHVPADGIAVATPTGSTAYFLSAGGPILDPTLAAFGIVALLPHTLFSRPVIVPDTAVIEIVSDTETAELEVYADGHVVEHLSPGERFSMRRYPRPIAFARREPFDFFSVLEAKLRWNAPIKDRER